MSIVVIDYILPSGIANAQVRRAILTQDDQELGRVKETRRGAFKVDAPQRPDYWLPIDLISEAEADSVRLSCERHHVTDFLADRPEDAEQLDLLQLLLLAHIDIELNLRSLLGSAPADSMQKSLAKLAQKIRAHERVEEQFLYGALSGMPHSPHQVIEWHRDRAHRFGMGRSDMSNNLNDAEWQNYARHLWEEVEHHFIREEGEVFPLVRELWGRARLLQAAQAAEPAHRAA